jgi:hypothetical protein
MEKKKAEKSSTKVVEQVVKKTKQTRNRPDLQNFGQDFVQPGDNTKLLTFQLQVARLPRVNTKDPVEVGTRINEYFEMCRQNDMKPSVMGLAVSLGLGRQALWELKEGRNAYTAEKGYAEVTYIVKNAYNLLELYWEQLMQNGKINPVSGIFLGKNHFGYQDKQDIVVTPNNPLGQHSTAEQLTDEYLLPDDTDKTD